jgi:predicted amidophosphoribosyltransferase
VLDKSTPLSYRRLLTREETIIQQKELDSKPERWTNAAGSVSVTTEIDNASVLLIDDICTSGASLSTAAHELRQAGAEEVVGIVYGLNTGWGDIIEINGPGATITHIKQLDEDKFR